MLTRNSIKLIISLQKKKVRDEEKLYIIEGDKIVKEYLASGHGIRMLIAKPEFISGLPAGLMKDVGEVVPATYEELKKLSSLKTPHNAMAVVRMTESRFSTEDILAGLCPALDFIQDPGNLGTIIRAAAWFGFKNIVCTGNCVDVYNPKVVQASMGALLNVSVHYTSLAELLPEAASRNIPVYGTMLEGEPIYSANLQRRGIILIGNESKGISEQLIPFITNRLSIPKFTEASTGIDSLNAGMAASIIFSEFARRFL
jgi:TrmH family RNA methyltransferase